MSFQVNTTFIDSSLRGQKVHARHHLRFYDARVITVKQPTMAEIAKSLRNAFELSKITHPSFGTIESLNLQNMGMELKDALKNMVNGENFESLNEN